MVHQCQRADDTNDNIISTILTLWIRIINQDEFEENRIDTITQFT